tara:strand:+ start:705 stop:1037 length:333 start_codon:yes stop_codon:yes gene_type:complete
MLKKSIFFLFFYFLVCSVSNSEDKKEQYCDIQTTIIKTVDTEGNIIEEKTEEKVVCDDSVKHFLEEAGVAKNCHEYVWMMPLGGELVEQRAIACEKLDGSYEIIPSYSAD